MNKGLNIIQIIPNLNEGGAERFVVDLSNELSKNNNVTLISFFDINERHFLDKELSNKINFITLNKRIGFDPGITIRLYKLLRRLKPDIVNTHLRGFEYCILCILILKKIKFFHTLHNDASKETSGMLQRLRRFFYRREFIKPVTISKESDLSFQKVYKLHNSTIIENGRVPPSKTTYYYQTEQEIKSFRYNSDTKIFVNIGRIAEQKNQLMLIKAFQRLVEEDFNVVLLIIGRAGEKHLTESIKQGLTDRIKWLGPKNNPTDYLYLADAFCLSSKYEGMPITLIEAFATGCIPICTPVGGIKNMVSHKHNGFLSRQLDENSFVEAVKEYMSAKNIINIKDNCINSYDKRYNIVITAKKYVNTYNN